MRTTLKSLAVALAVAFAVAPASIEAAPKPITEEKVVALIKRETKQGDGQAASQWRAVLKKIRGKKGGMTLAEVQEIVKNSSGNERRLWRRAREAVKQAMIAEALGSAESRFWGACFHGEGCERGSTVGLAFGDGDWETRVPIWNDLPSEMGHYGAWWGTARHISGRDVYVGFPQVWAEPPPGAEAGTALTLRPSVNAKFSGNAKGLSFRTGKRFGPNGDQTNSRIGEFTADILLQWKGGDGLSGRIAEFRGPGVDPAWMVDLHGIPHGIGTGEARVANDTYEGGALRTWSTGHWSATPYAYATDDTQTPGLTPAEPAGFVGTFDLRADNENGPGQYHLIGGYDATRDN